LLAKQLCKLIDMNEASNSLQLIIISHDLEFIKLLERYTNHYYEVSRDEEQFSKITKRDIREMFEQRRVF
jgi:DNA repair exonuclease SbcCD ATPase subunit